MADLLKFVQSQATTLAGAGATSTDTSIILTSFTDPDGVALTMTDFGNIGFGTLEPNSGTNEEQISFTGITQNGNGTATLTGVENVLFKAPYTQTSGLAKTHAGGTQFVISNTSGFYDKMTSKSNDETITGLYTFTQSPIVPDTTSSDLTKAANVLYVNTVGSTGTPDASTSVKGKSRLSTAPLSATEPIAVGDNDTRVPTVNTSTITSGQVAALAGTGTPNGTTGKYVTNDDTSATSSAGKLVRANGSGLIDTGFLPVTTLSLTAYANVVAGNPVKIVNDSGTGKVAPIFGIPTQQSTSGITGIGSIIDICYLSSTLVAVLFTRGVGNTQYQSAVAGTISGQTITWGSMVDFVSENTSGSPRDSWTAIRINAVSSTCFVATLYKTLSGTSTTVINAFVCTVSGNTITRGNVQTVSGDHYGPVDACSPSTDTIVFSTKNDADTKTYAVAGTVDEGARTITAGGILAISAKTTITVPRIHLLSSNRMFVTYYENTTTMYYGVITVSGNTLTRVTYDQTLTGLLSTGRFVKGSTDNTGLYAATTCYYLSESGGTITLTNSYATTYGGNINGVSVYDLSNNLFLVWTSTANTFQLVRCTSVGISADTSTKITGDTAVAITSFDNQKFIELCLDTNIILSVIGSFDWNYVFGFALSSISAGNVVTINLNGDKDTNQSGLIAGSIYYISPSAALTRAPTTILNTIVFTNKRVGISYSTTALSISI